MNQRVMRVASLLFCLAALPLAGCDSGPTTAPVSGKVLHNGQPLTTGTVTFVPEASGQAEAVGSIGEDGSYTLATGEQPGAPIGKYKVVVRSSVQGDCAILGNVA